MTELHDSSTFGLKGWIITLSSDLVHDIGANLISEHPHTRTNITTHAFDIDVGSAYPTSEICLNVSKTTNLFEMCGAKGIKEEELRSIGINLSSVKNNALLLAKKAYEYPDVDELLQKFKQVI